MQRTPVKKAGLVALTAIALVAASVATALAAPVLQPGVTSAPGMSGVCTDCHVYATPPAPTPPPVVTPPVVTPPVVTPPVVTPPAPPVVTPGAEVGHDSDEGDKPAVKKTTHHKKHPKTKTHHHAHD
jgi:hypothetical protein